MGSKRVLLIGLLGILLVFGLPYNSTAQDIDDVVFEDTKIQLTLLSNGTTFINIQALVKNSGLLLISSISLRIDVRSATITKVLFNNEPVDASIVAGDRYSIISITLNSPIVSNETGTLDIDLLTTDMQEEYSLDYERSLSLRHIIFYVRPTYLMQHLSISISLPPHAVLDTESFSLIFPTPSDNYTDGIRMVFVWELGPVFQGQESVFILKYGLPFSDPDTSNGTYSLIVPLSIVFILGLP